MAWLALMMGVMAVAGVGQAVFGYLATRRFAARLAVPAAPSRPPVTVLKPLHGDEPMLESALATLLAQRYGAYQVVFGVQDAADPAIAVVRRLRARFPGVDIDLVIDRAEHGANRKISNLINMLPSARHDILVIADSDVHVAPDYLDRIVDELAVPGTGLVTTVYAGLAADASLPAALGATGITHGFLPGALMARELGRQDCLGATMALRRETLAAIGGFAALVDHIADDHVLGKLVRAEGLAIRMAATVTATTVPETAMPALFQHELRWARTILALVPREYALSVIQYPLFWAGLAIGFSGGADWTVALFLLCWATRALCGHGIDRCLSATHPGFAAPVPVWLLPLRDLMSMFIAVTSYRSDRVEWRGRVMHTGRSGQEHPVPEYRPGSFGEPDFAPPRYAASSYGASSYGAPNYGAQTYGAQNYGASSYAPPGPSAAS